MRWLQLVKHLSHKHKGLSSSPRAQVNINKPSNVATARDSSTERRDSQHSWTDKYPINE